MIRARLCVAFGFLVVSASACSSWLRSPCESACYGTKTNEPSDFNDCMKRCRR